MGEEFQRYSRNVKQSGAVSGGGASGRLLASAERSIRLILGHRGAA